MPSSGIAMSLVKKGHMFASGSKDGMTWNDPPIQKDFV